MEKQIKPSEGEMEILQVLWEKGPASVRDVHEALSKDGAYTTTLKLMQIMLEKALLKRDAGSKVHIYEAAVRQDQVQRQAVRRIIDTVFNGSAMSLVMQALGSHKTSSDELDQIRRYLNEIDPDKRLSGK